MTVTEASWKRAKVPCAEISASLLAQCHRRAFVGAKDIP